MKENCHVCKGKGYIVTKYKCPDCNGLGFVSLTMGAGVEGRSEKDKCKRCNGKGEIYEREPCLNCLDGSVYYCDLCGTKLDSKTHLCPSCDEDPFVIKLVEPIDEQYLKGRHALLGKVIETKNGIIVSLGGNYKGKVMRGPRQKINHLKVNDEVAVRILRKNQDLFELYVSGVNKYRIVEKRKDLKPINILAISMRQDGTPVAMIGKVVDIVQTTGPTAFTIMDETTATVSAAAYIAAGKRAYPEIQLGDVVKIYAEVSHYRGQLQLVVRGMEKLSDDAIESFNKKIEETLLSQSKVKDDITPLVSHAYITGLIEPMKNIASIIRRAVIEKRPIIIRYHSPCVDGAVSSIILTNAIKLLHHNLNRTTDEIKYLIRRLPQRTPYYDVSDATRDISSIIDDFSRFKDSSPLFITLDLGSSNESKYSYELIRETYNFDLLVIDHHLMDDDIKSLVTEIVNPHLITEDYAISTGMLSLELANMILNGETDITHLKHLAAVSGISDRVTGEVLEAYVNLAKETGFEKESLENIVLVADYMLYHLKFIEHTTILKQTLGVQNKNDIHVAIIDKTLPVVNKILEATTQAVINNMNVVKDGDLAIMKLDVEMFTTPFEFPSPGKLTGIAHEFLVSSDSNKKLLSLGIGPDFLIYRASGIHTPLPVIIKKLKETLPYAGINGGGHAQIGTLKFYRGFKDHVIEELIKLAKEEN